MAGRNAVAWSIYEKLGSPRFICAPMVDASELPFRALVRKYGTQLCYSPMIHARLFREGGERHKARFLTTNANDRPLVVQFCANDPDDFLASARMVQDECDAVDLNLGCPQRIAKHGNYGAFLCNQRDLVRRIVEKATSSGLKVPVFCKIRRQETIEDTVAYAKMLEEAGAMLITVHGRTKEQKGQNEGLADWDVITAVRKALSIPVFANGNIRDMNDVEKCLEVTGCAGVMSAVGLLRDPSLFRGIPRVPPCDILQEYLDICGVLPPHPKMIKAHTFYILEDILRDHIDIRARFGRAWTRADFEKILADLKHRIDNNIPGPLELPPELRSKKRKKGGAAALENDNEHDNDNDDENHSAENGTTSESLVPPPTSSSSSSSGGA
eukprot:comp22107_c0_seq1/m.51416 comp22107_c0_seq1/g.51416  ORF comp22107_c0_seq1/g.51416 comp22107_c0_seq1/m.51416 type:complete len:383 (-) comp22107_c0_seq1:1674-2822(-)